MGSPWSELLANLAVVAMFVSVWIHTHVWLDRRPAPVKAAAFGLLMGAGAIVLMLTPMQLQPGVLVDLRATMIAIAGFFGGPVAGIVAGVMAGAFRTFEGGIGAFAGAVGIAATMLVGVAGNLALRGRRPSMADIMILGAAAACGSLLGLSVLPRSVVQTVLPQVVFPSSLLIFVSVAMSGLALYQERRRLEALQSRRIFKAVVETLPDCLNVKDLDGRFIAANPATAELMHAANAKALIGKTDFDFYPSETARAFREDELAVLASGTASTIEQHLHHEDGTDGWLATLKAPFRDRTGAVIGLITHNRDITERKRLETELAESQARLGDALTHMADGLVMFDPAGKLILCNAQYRALFPKTADIRVPGTDYRDILRASVARGERVNRCPRSLRNACRPSLRPVSFNCPYTCSDAVITSLPSAMSVSAPRSLRRAIRNRRGRSLSIMARSSTGRAAITFAGISSGLCASRRIACRQNASDFSPILRMDCFCADGRAISPASFVSSAVSAASTASNSASVRFSETIFWVMQQYSFVVFRKEPPAPMAAGRAPIGARSIGTGGGLRG